jgi:hypothetical protein
MQIDALFEEPGSNGRSSLEIFLDTFWGRS